MRPNLRAAYLAAEYVLLRPRIVIRIGEPNAQLDALIAPQGRAAFVTAVNPGSERLGDEENRRRLDELRAALEAKGYRHLEGEGRDPKGAWPPEPSFLVVGVPRGAAAALARRFAQNAFVWCEAGRPPELAVVATQRLVLDAHVWLDWLAFGDPSAAPIREAVAQARAEIYMDAACEAELERVLAYPIGKKVPDKALQEARLAEARRIARPPARALTEAERATLPRCRDRDDQKFLELALAAHADALVTKDRELLALARRVPFRIVAPADLDFA